MKIVLLTIFFYCFHLSGQAQTTSSTTRADSLLHILENTEIDSTRLYLSYFFGNRSLYKNPVEAIKYYETAYELSKSGVTYYNKNKNNVEFRGSIINGLAIAYETAGDIKNAIRCRIEFLELAQKEHKKDLEILALNNLGSLHEIQNNFGEAMRYYRSSLQMALEINDNYDVGIGYGNLGAVYFDMGNLDSARHYYITSLPYLEKIDSKEGKFGALGWMMNNIGSLYFEQRQFDSAYVYFHLSKNYREEIDHRMGRYMVYGDLADLHESIGNEDSAIYYINKSIQLGSSNGFISDLGNSYLLRSKIYGKKKKFEQALYDYIEGIKLRDSAISEENSKSILKQSMKYEYDKSKLADSLEFSKKEAVLTEHTEKQRLGLFALAVGLVLLFLLAYAIYKGKKSSDNLLLNILPEKVAAELKKKGRAEAKQFDNVTVMFTDFKDFTQVSEKLTASELVDEINYCYSEFDRIITKYNLEKIKTIGDSYMSAAGLPVPNNNSAIDAVNAAIEIRDFILKEKQNRESQGKAFFELRVGLHTGPVVAGIVGLKKFAYDIWGDTVNIASRMESSGETGKINVSGSTYSMIKDKFSCTFRGKIEAKNKGEIEMYFVEKNENPVV